MEKSSLDKRCAQCGEAFRCAAGPDCWCVDFPNVLPADGNTGDCLCPSCLRARLEEAYRQRGLPKPPERV